MVIKRVGPLSVAKIFGTLHTILGLIIGAFVSLFALIGGIVGHTAARSSDSASLLGASLIGVGAIIIFPICYGLLGFIGSLISAALYNVLARNLGGIRLEVETDALDSAARLQSGAPLNQLAERTDYPAQ